jgi:drug/metabolite transporter (DMT)-like permease
MDASQSAAALKLGPFEWGLLALHSTLWGSAFFFVDIAKADIQPFTINAFRLLPASLILLTVVVVSGIRLRPLLAVWPHILALALFNNALPFILICYGQSQVVGGVAAVFIATTPMFGLLLAHLMTHDEKLSLNKLLGIAAGIAGVAVLTGGAVAQAASGAMLANLALVGAAMCYATAGIFSRALRHVQPFAIATGQMIGSLLLSMPLALLIDQPWTLPVPAVSSILAVAASGTFGSALAAMCYFTILRRSGVTNALLVTLLIPLTPIGLGALFLGQRLQPHEFAGAAIIAAALLIIDGRLFARTRLLPGKSGS